eukprot:612316_1
MAPFGTFYSSYLVLLSLVLCTACSAYHILVASTSPTYSHWSQILHVSKGLLSRKRFITFVIDESKDEYLNTIRDEPFPPSSHQILYTQKEPSFDIEQFTKSNIIQHVLTMNDLPYTQSMASFEPIAVFLNHTQSNYPPNNRELMNRNLKQKRNHIGSLILHKKVDVCLLDATHFFAISLCHSFGIPTIIRISPAAVSWLEYSTISATHLYYLNQFLPDKDVNVINGSVITYAQKWKRFTQNLMFTILQRFMAYYKAIPLLSEFNKQLMVLNIDASFDVNQYKNGWFSFWEKAAVISSLGPPFSGVMYHRPRIKQFGFILYPSAEVQESELWTWMDSDDTRILVISMGSAMVITENEMHRIYTQLLEHSQRNNYRVLWALRQHIYSNVTNESLQRKHFKITRWIPQFEVLQHEKVKLFLSHAGSGGVIEALYSKKLMILYPHGADQYMMAQRLVELECGLIIKDRDNLTQYIERLLLNTTTAEYYQSKVNHMHRMISQNGGIKEAVDFVEYAAEYGIKHLMCAYGTNYDCTKTVIPWYQQCMWDIYLVILVSIFVFWRSEE